MRYLLLFSQRLFRKRKQEHVETLEKQVIHLEQQLELCRQENNYLHGLISYTLDAKKGTWDTVRR